MNLSNIEMNSLSVTLAQVSTKQEVSSSSSNPTEIKVGDVAQAVLSEKAVVPAHIEPVQVKRSSVERSSVGDWSDSDTEPRVWKKPYQPVQVKRSSVERSSVGDWSDSDTEPRVWKKPYQQTLSFYMKRKI